jgi:integrase-like protein
VTERARREYAEALRPRYTHADKRERGRMLDEYCRATGSHRKAAIRCLRRADDRGRRPPGRPRRYGPALAPTLERVWLASDRLCGKLLAPILPTLVQALERHHALVVPDEVRRALLDASPATLDRLLRPLRRQRRRQPYRPSPGVAALRQQISVRTWSDWGDVAPGALQGDLVLHCGESTGGFYLATLLAIDVATSWTELEPVWGLGHHRVGNAVHHIRQRLPVPLREWHSDNGGEFINDHLVVWCRREGIRFTRGRPYRKNDQAWVAAQWPRRPPTDWLRSL